MLGASCDCFSLQANHRVWEKMSWYLDWRGDLCAIVEGSDGEQLHYTLFPAPQACTAPTASPVCTRAGAWSKLLMPFCFAGCACFRHPCGVQGRSNWGGLGQLPLWRQFGGASIGVARVPRRPKFYAITQIRCTHKGMVGCGRQPSKVGMLQGT